MRQTAGSGNDEAVWREAREWWAGAPYVQFRRFTDEKGIRRVDEKHAPSLGILLEPGQIPLYENHKEEWSLRMRKIRDEKVAAACGSLPTAYYEREAKERRA